MILRNPDWDWYVQVELVMSHSLCLLQASTLETQTPLVSHIWCGVGDNEWACLAAISYQIQSNRLQKKYNTKLEVWEKIPISFGFVSFSFISLVWIVWWVWLEIYIFCDILTLLRKFRNYSMKLDGKTNWWLRAGRERTSSQAPPAPVKTKTKLGRKERSASLNPQEEDNIYIFTVCQYQI